MLSDAIDTFPVFPKMAAANSQKPILWSQITTQNVELEGFQFSVNTLLIFSILRFSAAIDTFIVVFSLSF